MAALLSSFLQRQRLNIAKPYIHGDVLDLGCGFGEITGLVPPSNYIGIDGQSKIVDWLKINHTSYDFLCYNLDNDQLLFNKKFDTIVMLAVIEHLSNPDNVLSQIPKLLKEDGSLILTTPAPVGDTVHQFGAKIGLFSKHAVEDHEIIFTLDSIKPYLIRNGLAIKEFRRFLFGTNQLFICERYQQQN
jgi:2-polyprenyl-3-methyl-5-hydroxy-6-metoxy-1,4-benzoquinol methylase